MKKLLRGVEKFQSEVYCAKKDLFDALSQEGQHPRVLFIACSDSRVDPTMLTQSGPGELFVLRNAGNIIPPFTGNTCGEAATIEYAVNILQVEHIIICGHSRCGAIMHLVDHHDHPYDDHLPMVSKWLRYADATRTITEAHWSEYSDANRYDFAIETNIRVQLNNLCTHPSIAQALSCKKLQLHGWVYHVESGELHLFDRQREAFTIHHTAPQDIKRNMRTNEAKRA
ncbi:MAG: carbonic anhydrase [Vampirovibrionales bacterium]|nr:carbonic anhydrase [Vampirovibrionales bacterium]